LPTVLSASENFALKSSSSVSRLDARWQPIVWATLITSSRVLLTRTKNVTLMSARMLSWQIRPSLPRRSISIVFTEMSITSDLWMIGITILPVNVTSGSDLRVLTMSAFPCSTFL
jgi:hypothetical protein